MFAVAVVLNAGGELIEVFCICCWGHFSPVLSSNWLEGESREGEGGRKGEGKGGERRRVKGGEMEGGKGRSGREGRMEE